MHTNQPSIATFAPNFAQKLCFSLAIVVFAGTALAQAALPSPEMQAQTALPRSQLRIGMYQIQAQVAQTEAQRATGLMFRQSMPDNEGMLFVFEEPAVQCFWMKNTLLPLTAAFIDDAGKIVNLADMQPKSEKSHCSKSPVRYVLEMKRGWFAKRGFKAGHVVSMTP